MSEEQAPQAVEPSQGAVFKAIRSYFREFGALKECGREFWVVQLVNLLDGVAYFAMLTVSTLYLSETLGYSDKSAANLWALCMMLYTGTGLVAGFIGDSFGIRRTLYLSVVMLVASRIVISLTTAKPVVIPALFVISVGTAIMTPILISATKRYTTPRSQTAGFNMLYLLMNIGAFLGNFTIDPLRALEWGNRSVFMAGSVMSILCWISILVFWRRPLARVDAQAKDDQAAARKAEEQAAKAEVEEKWEAPWEVAWSVIRESAFWRFMLLLVILVGVRLCFEHQYQVYPKYYIRTMSEFAFAADSGFASQLDEESVAEEFPDLFVDQGVPLQGDVQVNVQERSKRWELKDELQTYTILAAPAELRVYESNVPVGALNSINPAIICIGVIISTPIVARFKLFNVMFLGIVVSAVSMFALAIHPPWLVERFGVTLTDGYRIIVLTQIIVFSIGEVIWYPRLYEYTATVAPKRREASYMGLSYVPMVFARGAEGPLAGLLLTRYCPPDVTDRLATVPYTESPQFMCLILALIAIATPVLIVLLKPIIQKGSRIERDEQLGGDRAPR